MKIRSSVNIARAPVSVECSIKIDFEELEDWEPERIEALMQGVADVIVAARETERRVSGGGEE